MTKAVNNFAGLNGFVWWTGVVENRMDPLQVGRCQCRIFGWHTENLQLIPSADLPWCMPLYPLNRSKDFSTPKEGDYVVGFFFDGESGQFPVMMGVLPGIQGGFPTGSVGFQDVRTAGEIAAAPQVPNGQVQNTPGQPTIVPLARGEIANSAISATNSARSAVVDITAPIKASLAAAKLQALAFVQEIRLAKDALIASFAVPGQATADEIKNNITQAKAKVTAYAEEAKAVTVAIKEVNAAVTEITQTVAYINNLPTAVVQEINSEINLPGQTGGLANSILANAQSEINKLENSIKV